MPDLRKNHRTKEAAIAMPALSGRLQKAREARGLTVTAAARAAGISRPSYNNAEKPGQAGPQVGAKLERWLAQGLPEGSEPIPTAGVETKLAAARWAIQGPTPDSRAAVPLLDDVIGELKAMPGKHEALLREAINLLVVAVSNVVGARAALAVAVKYVGWFRLTPRRDRDAALLRRTCARANRELEHERWLLGAARD